MFGHVARLGKDTPAHQALQRQIYISFERLPDRTRKRHQVAEEASGWIVLFSQMDQEMIIFLQNSTKLRLLT